MSIAEGEKLWEPSPARVDAARITAFIRWLGELRKSIAVKLRTEASPRHVPDDIYSVPEVPYTLSLKKMEVPVRKILTGADPDNVASRDTMSNPASLDWFVEFSGRRESKI
jgi:hypothetical protein